ncbi:MAG: hypothetical protein ACOC2L_01870, partial [Candidatus Sumerlaeota bacterium]
MAQQEKKMETSGRILILGGNMKEIPSVIEQLEESRFVVTMAMSGGDAIKCLREREFDALIIGTDLEK